jgi:sphingosine kinase
MSNLEVTLIKTEYSGHAFELTREKIGIGQYDGIIFISGDGLIHEGINGVMSRDDKSEFLEKTTFGFIPAGTSNGLIKSILEHNNESCDAQTAAFRICKGQKMKIDVTEL